VADLERGVYEHLITQELAGRLRLVDDDLVQRDKLDPADADELLPRHFAVLARRALRAVPGSDQDRLTAQVAVANRIADSIAALQPQMVGADDQVADAEHLLAAIIDRPKPPTPPRFPVRPSTPLSTGALLVNGPRATRRGAVHICRYLMITRSRPTSSPPSIAVASPTALTAFSFPRSFSVMSAPAISRCTST
jgi:hypothetical protein